MPIIGVKRDKLFEALGQTYTEDEFNQLCFEYGIELDDVTSEKEMLRKELAVSASSLSSASEEVIYKIDIPANRYDMLCLEGIARALNIFRGRVSTPTYTLAGPHPSRGRLERIVMKPETTLVRPFIMAAVLRGVSFDPTRYNSFIDLQDKLHQNLCRQRSLASMGTHDLATVKGPFVYDARPPSQIEFVPLKQTESFNAVDLMKHYLANDLKLRKFVPIIEKSLVYPVVLDSEERVLSLPPIINSAHSAISLATRDVLIECTATDRTKAQVVVNTLCAMFSEYCDRPFDVEPVEIVDAKGRTTLSPDLTPRQMTVDVDYVNACTGLSLGRADMSTLLTKMQLGVLDEPAVDELSTSLPHSAASNTMTVSIPVTRSDVLHPCDVMEDVAIAHGYNNLPATVPTTMTMGGELALNQMCELLRAEVAAAGFSEVLTWTLCSRDECFGFMRRADDGTAVALANPATAEFEVCRTSLLPAALKTLAAHRDAPLPVRLFEVSDAVVKDGSAAVGARNRRRLVAVHCDKGGGFEVVHGLLNRAMEVLRVPLAQELAHLEAPAEGGVGGRAAAARARSAFGGGYAWRGEDHPSFLPGRRAVVRARGEVVGEFGIVHPEVLAAFDICYPVSALELDLGPFCFDQGFRSVLHQPFE